MKTVATKKDEIITIATTSEEMFGKYLAKRVFRKWKEKVIDESTGEEVELERNELIENKGAYLNNDTIPQILFHIETGDIKGVLVSNQKRVAELRHCCMMLWFVTARIGVKSHKFLVNANSVAMALEITKDHIELSFKDNFIFTQVKDFSNYIAIEDKFTKIDEIEEGKKGRKFYKVTLKVQFHDGEDEEEEYNFIVNAIDVDYAMLVINNFIADKVNEEEEGREYSTTLESATTIPCDYLIEKEFSMAYSGVTE